MISTFMSSKYFRLLCYFIIIPLLSSCYSHFAIKESIEDVIVKKQTISKIKLKNETEINFYNNENVLVAIDSDSLTYQDSKGDTHKTAIKDVVQWYEYQLDDGKTFFSILWIGFSIILLALLTGTRLWGG